MKYFALVAVIFVLSALIVGIVAVGSPASQRSQRFDERRVADLQGLEGQIIYYWQTKGVLPESLQILGRDVPNYILPADSMTGNAYEYGRTSDRSFILCGQFDTASNDQYRTFYGDSDVPVPPRKVPGSPLSWNWNHGVGHTCFDRTIDPDFFPPAKLPKKLLPE
jgi:hypothetical protein